MTWAEGRRAFEEHVLEEVGDAGLLVGLVAAPRTEKQADGGRTSMGHGGNQDTQAVGEHDTVILAVSTRCSHVFLLARS